jgi:putative hemolysin
MIRRLVIVLGVYLFLASPVLAWNTVGHFTVAKLAWRQLTPEQRAKATAILKTHPHYEEFLAAEKPDGVELDEWVFWRASYWPDWIRNHHTEEYSKPTWHYISAGYVPPYSKLDPAKLVLPPPNAVTQITESIEKLRSGTDQEKPIYFCWLLHLVGDIHQPLHNCSLLSETFPDGDRGGNESLVRIEGGRPVQLHKMFDDLLGQDRTPSAIGAAAAEADQAEREIQETVDRELKEHTTPAEWTKEGFALAVKFAYLDGDLRPANNQAKPPDDEVPNVAEVYAQNAGRMARVQVAKAGKRLAVCVAQGLD